MDKDTATELLETVRANARELGIGIEIEALGAELDGLRADALLRIGRGPDFRTYAAEIKRGIRPTTLGAVLHQLDRFQQPRLLIADYVTPTMAETLRARGIAFLDAAGNAYLEQPRMLVWVKGARPAEKLGAGVGAGIGRMYRPAGLQVLFVLLCHPEWIDQPYRILADQAGVAHGTVGVVMAELKKLGFVAEIGGRRRLLQQEKLLKQWTEAYARTLRPKLLLGRYRTGLKGPWAKLDLRRYGILLGGEIAAEKITGHLRAETVTLYGKKADPRLLIDYKLRADPDGPVELVKRFWAFGTDDEVVPLPLIYADLLMIGDARCLEAADLIYERILDGLVG